MNSHECPICSGSKQIRLPVRKPVSSFVPTASIAIPRTMERDTFRIYSCPECTTTPDHKLHVAQSEMEVRAKIGTELMESVRVDIAHHLVDYLLRHELVQFREEKRGGAVTAVIARLAVVEPSAITPLEHRVREALAPALEKLAKNATAKISIWGRDLGLSTITKDDAVQFIEDALREEWAKATPIGPGGVTYVGR